MQDRRHDFWAFCILFMVYAAIFNVDTFGIGRRDEPIRSAVLCAAAIGTLVGYLIGHPIRTTLLSLVAAIAGIVLGAKLGHTAFAPWLLRIVDQLKHR